MVNDESRRRFLWAAPLAAAAGFSLTDAAFAGVAAAGASFQLFSAEDIAGMVKATQAAPGNKNLVDPTAIPLAVVITTEVDKAAKEFEWHEGRDHFVQILDGTTLYEVGGTPKDGRNTKAGEWLAPDSVGATRYELKKGDMLLIPRGTAHRRKTAGTVTFMLISSSGR
jgi:quercetin dioxygenase-like cupin family protein